MNNSDLQLGICNRLELILEKREISKAEMARLCNLPSRTVENYFKGYTPSLDALLSLSKGLGVPFDWLLGDINYPGIEINTRVFRSVEDAVASYLQIMVDTHGSGNEVIQGNSILNMEIPELAAKIASNAHQKFQYLSIFAGDEMPTLTPEALRNYKEGKGWPS